IRFAALCKRVGEQPCGGPRQDAHGLELLRDHPAILDDKSVGSAFAFESEQPSEMVNWHLPNHVGGAVRRKNMVVGFPQVTSADPCGSTVKVCNLPDLYLAKKRQLTVACSRYPYGISGLDAAVLVARRVFQETTEREIIVRGLGLPV